jgi:pullulanase
VLWDKLAISAKDASVEERIEMQKLALSIVLTSQGISFLHAGTEFLRTKKGVENSFESPDSINAIDWSLKTRNKEIFEYVKGLIKMRKDHPAFRMTSAKDIAGNIQFINAGQKGSITYIINGQKVNDKWKKVFVVLNSDSKKTISIPKGIWKTAILNNHFEDVYIPKLIAEPYSCTILYQE